MSAILKQVRRGLAEPFAETVQLPALSISRREARAIERALSERRFTSGDARLIDAIEETTR